MSFDEEVTKIEPTPRPSRGRILLAEDDRELADLVSEVLDAEGYTVETVTSGPGLLSALSSPESIQRYDVVLSDHRMPGLTGIDVLALIDEDERPPVIMMTAFPSAGIQRAARDFGATAVLSKPFDLESVRALVEWVIEKRAAAPHA